MGKWGAGKVLKLCNFCKCEFYARNDRPGKYCSKSCSRKDKPNPCPNTKITKICNVCKKEFIVKKYRKESALYCSCECRRKRMPKGEDHPRWNGGISERPFHTRKAILELRKTINNCQNCGSDYRLQGHHIISYSERPDLANDKKNIIILCVHCHAKEHPEYANLILKGGVYG